MEVFILSTVLLIGDWMQTREIVRNPNLYEMNLFLGEEPSMRKVDLWFTGAIATNAVIGLNLPKKYQKFWFSGVSIVEFGFNVNNYQLGIKYKY